MRFATFNSKPPSASLGVVSGHLDGSERVLVAFNCLTRIAVFEQSSVTGELAFLDDIPLHCSLKYMKVIPITDPDSHRTVRHVLFLLSMKQEIVLATFDRLGTDAERQPLSLSGTATGDLQQSGRVVRLITLYHSGFDDCLHQFNPGEVSLTCATAERCSTPLVAFSVNRGDIYFLDVLAALASCAQTADAKRRKSMELLGAVFPASVVAAATARRGVTPISRASFDFTEFDVKDISFDASVSPASSLDSGGAMGLVLPEMATAGSPPSSSSSSPPASATTAAPVELFVLFADRHGRCHVSQYSYSTSVAVPVQPPSTGMFPFSRDVLSDPGARAVRQGMVQSNVDPSATFLVATASGLYVLGNHLVTFLALRSPGRRRAITCELPPSPTGGAVLSCVCSSSSSSSTGAASTHDEALMVCFTDGVCGRISLAMTPADAVVGGSSPALLSSAPANPTLSSAATASGEPVLVGAEGGAHHAPQLSIQFFLHVLPTIPTAIVAVSDRFSVIASRFSDSLFVDLHTGTTSVVLKNCGPILGMEVVRDGPRASVVASTGINANGGVSLVRSAVTFQEHTVVELRDHVVAVHTSHHLIALSMRDGGPRFFCAVDGTASSLCDVTRLMPPALVASHTAIVALSGQASGDNEVVYTIATRHGLFEVQQDCRPRSAAAAAASQRPRDGPVDDRFEMTIKATSPFKEEAMFASLCGRLCAVAGNATDIRLFKGAAESSWTVPVSPSSRYLSTLHLATEALLLYGDWVQEAVHVVMVDPNTPAGQSPVLSQRSIRMPSVPRSVCALGHRLFAGLLSGSVVEMSVDSGEVVHQAVVSHQPVDLCVLPGHTDTLLCRGPVPLVLLLKDGIQVTGLSTTSATSCSTMTLLHSHSPHYGHRSHSRGARVQSGRGAAGSGGGGGGGDAAADTPQASHNHTHNTRYPVEDEEGEASPDAVAASGEPTLVIWSHEDRELVVGSVEQTQKLNQTFLGLRGTVTHIADVPQWDAFAVSVRRPEKDEVLLVPHSFVTNSGIIASPLLAASAEGALLENERCVFFEPLRLPTGDSNGGSRSDNGAPVVSLTPSVDARADDPATSLLVGSTFVFPDEQRARSSRIAWFRCTAAYAAAAAMAPGGGAGGKKKAAPAGLQLVGEKDISGALQCCCVVPNYPGRIALGVSGCILTFHWSAVDATFVAEERCHVGLSLAKLIPLPAPVTPLPSVVAPAAAAVVDPNGPAEALLPAASMVALDARHSATYIYVDPVQGSVKVVGRDAKVRGIVAGTWVSGAAAPSQGDNVSRAGGLCMADDSLNLYYVEYGKVDRVRRGDRDGDTNEQAQGQGMTSTPPPRACVVTAAQAHIGDLITCLCPGSFAPSILRDSALAPSTLVKGIAGQQLVYGTAHGAFGTITPLTASTHLFLRAIEAAMHRAVPSSAGFQHGAFREILVTGQERGASRNASFNVLQAITQERRRDESARACVDGDYVETFLRLTPETQRKVMHLAEVYLTGWSTSSSRGDDVDSDKYPSDVPYPEATGMASPTAADNQSREACNRLLQDDDLPLLPLNLSAVCGFLQALQWIH